MRRRGLAALTLQELDQQRLGVKNGGRTPPDTSPVSQTGNGKSATPGISDVVLFWGTTAKRHTDKALNMEFQTTSTVN